MNDALLKSLTLLLLIIIGLLLKGKFGNRDQVNGIKELVLTIALPTTIFISLMKIEMDGALLMVPVMTLAFNCIMYVLTPLSFGWFHIEKDSAAARTMTMLVPSLAPGLSCFPFIAEFLGQKSLAVAALADVGNKFFVLIALYMLALSMYLKNNKAAGSEAPVNRSDKIKSLLKSLVSEPINLFIFAALALLGFGVGYDSLPAVITSVFDRTSAMMTPLVLIYIGLAVQLKEGKKKMVMSILMFRAGITLLLSGLVIFLAGIADPGTALLVVVIPLSSASFWPMAHISAFNLKEDTAGVSREGRTFDLNLAILVLAFSLPFSTLLILGILSSGTLFAHTPTLIFSGLALLAVSFVPQLLTKVHFGLSKA